MEPVVKVKQAAAAESQAAVKVDADDDDSDDDSCPIEPFLEDSDLEGEILKKEEPRVQASVKEQFVPAVVEAVAKEAKEAKPEPEVVEATAGAGEQVGNDDSDDDSCPIEPFLEDSDVEIEVEQVQPAAAAQPRPTAHPPDRRVLQ